MTRMIAELNIDLKSGSYITTYMPVKSRKDFAKKMNKMMDKGELRMCGIVIDVREIDNIGCKFESVN